MPDRNLLTIYGVAELLNITPERVRRMARDGIIPIVELPVGIIRFDPADLQAFIGSHRRPLESAHLPI